MSTKTVKAQGGKGGRSTAPSPAPSPAIRNRNVGVRRVRACDLVAHPLNWRQHPKTQQDALRGVLNEVGFVGTLLAYELSDGRLQLIDGHLRQETIERWQRSTNRDAILESTGRTFAETGRERCVL